MYMIFFFSGFFFPFQMKTILGVAKHVKQVEKHFQVLLLSETFTDWRD